MDGGSQFIAQIKAVVDTQEAQNKLTALLKQKPLELTVDTSKIIEKINNIDGEKLGTRIGTQIGNAIRNAIQSSVNNVTITGVGSRGGGRSSGGRSSGGNSIFNDINKGLQNLNTGKYTAQIAQMESTMKRYGNVSAESMSRATDALIEYRTTLENLQRMQRVGFENVEAEEFVANIRTLSREYQTFRNASTETGANVSPQLQKVLQFDTGVYDANISKMQAQLKQYGNQASQALDEARASAQRYADILTQVRIELSSDTGVDYDRVSELLARLDNEGKSFANTMKTVSTEMSKALDPGVGLQKQQEVLAYLEKNQNAAKQYGAQLRQLADDYAKCATEAEKLKLDQTFSSIKTGISRDNLGGSSQVTSALKGFEELRTGKYTSQLSQMQTAMEKLGDVSGTSMKRASDELAKYIEELSELENLASNVTSASSEGFHNVDIDEFVSRLERLKESYVAWQNAIKETTATFTPQLQKNLEQLNVGAFDSNLTTMKAKLKEYGEQSSESLDKARESAERYDAILAQIREELSSGDAVDYKHVGELFSELESEGKRFANTMKDVSATMSKSLAPDVGLQKQQEVLLYLQNNSRAAGKYGDELRKLADDYAKCSTEAEKAKLDQQFTTLKNAISMDGLNGGTIFDSVAKGLKNLTGLVSTYRLIMMIPKAIKSMVSEVRAVDVEMTTIRKITGATSDELSDMFESATEKAKEYGSAISDIMKSQADWIRLGYSMDEAKELASVTALFQQVGDNMTQENTSSALISTIRGFGLGVADATHIVDAYNNVADHMPIATDELAASLTRSASAMHAAGNTMEETMALITATNSVVQNPEKVGTAFQMISMRIRGAKTEMEEAGLETEGMLTSVSKIREEVKGLADVDIMIDDSTFKSTYQILDELSQKWGDLTDIQQAALTELLAGKRQGNVMSAIMQNFDVAREALELGINSEGVAQKELENYQKGIEYHFGVLKATFQDFSNTVLNSDTIIFFVDALQKLLEVLTKIVDVAGMLPTLFAGFSAFKVLSTLTKDFKGLQAIGQSAGWLDGIKSLLNIGKAGTATGGLGNAFGSMNKDAESAAKGIATVTRSVSGSGGLLAALKGLVATHPLLAIVAGATTAISVFMSIRNAIKKANEEAKKLRFDNIKQDLKNVADRDKDLDATIQKVTDLRTELADENTSSSRAYEIKSEIYKIQEQLNESYGAFASNLNIVNGELDSEIEKMRTLSQQDAQEVVNKNRQAYREAREALYGKEYDETVGKSGSSITSVFASDLFNGQAEVSASQYTAVTKAIAKAAKDAGLTVDDDQLNLYQKVTLTFDGNTVEAKDAFNTLLTSLGKLEKEFKSKGLDIDFSSIIEPLSTELNEASKYVDQYKDVVTEYEEQMLRADSTLYGDENRKTAYNWFSDYAEAIEELNKALSTGENIDAAIENFTTLDSEIIGMVNSGELEQYSEQFTGLKESLNDAGVSAYKFKNTLKSALSDASSKYSIWLKDLKGKVTDTDIKNMFLPDGLFGKSQDFSSFRNAAQSDEIGQIIYKLIGNALESGVFEDDVTWENIAYENIQPLVQMLMDLGVVAKDTSSSVSTVPTTVEDVTEEVSKAVDNTTALFKMKKTIDSLFDSLSKGEDIDFSIFEDDDLVDFAEAIDQVNGKLTINEKKLRQIAQEKFAKQYSENMFAISHLNALKDKNLEELQKYNDKSSENYKAIEKENDGIENTINRLTALNSVIMEARVSYQRWNQDYQNSVSGTSTTLTNNATIKSLVESVKESGTIDPTVFDDKNLRKYTDAFTVLNGEVKVNEELVNELTDADINNQIVQNKLRKTLLSAAYSDVTKKIEAQTNSIERMSDIDKKTAKAQIALNKETAESIQTKIKQLEFFNQQLEGSLSYNNSWANAFANAVEKTETLESNLSSISEVLNSITTGKSVDPSVFNSTEMLEYADALEYVNGSLQVNEQRVKEITEAKVKEQVQLNETAKALARQEYHKNAQAIQELLDKQSKMTKGEEDWLEVQSQIDTLEAGNDVLANKCNLIDLYTKSLIESTGAYQEWLNAQGGSDERDMADNIVKAMDEVKDVFTEYDSSGKRNRNYGAFGTDEYEASVNLLIPETVDSTDREAVKKYVENLRQYFTGDKDGVDRFIYDAIDKGLMEVDDDGLWGIAGEKSMQDFMDKFNITEDVAMAMMGMLNTYYPELELQWTLPEDEEFGEFLKNYNTEGIDALSASKGEEYAKVMKSVMDAMDGTDEATQKALSTLTKYDAETLKTIVNSDEVTEETESVKKAFDSLAEALDISTPEGIEQLYNVIGDLSELAYIELPMLEGFDEGIQLKINTVFEQEGINSIEEIKELQNLSGEEIKAKFGVETTGDVDQIKEILGLITGDEYVAPITVRIDQDQLSEDGKFTINAEVTADNIHGTITQVEKGGTVEGEPIPLKGEIDDAEPSASYTKAEVDAEGKIDTASEASDYLKAKVTAEGSIEHAEQGKGYTKAEVGAIGKITNASEASDYLKAKLHGEGVVDTATEGEDYKKGEFSGTGVADAAEEGEGYQKGEFSGTGVVDTAEEGSGYQEGEFSGTGVYDQANPSENYEQGEFKGEGVVDHAEQGEDYTPAKLTATAAIDSAEPSPNYKPTQLDGTVKIDGAEQERNAVQKYFNDNPVTQKVQLLPPDDGEIKTIYNGDGTYEEPEREAPRDQTVVITEDHSQMSEGLKEAEQEVKDFPNETLVDVDADTESANAKLKETNVLENMVNDAPMNPTATVRDLITSEVIRIKSLLESLNNMRVTTYVETVRTESPGGNGGWIQKEFKANGTAHASGTAMAKGSWAVDHDQTALTGELGKEIIVDSRTGTWRTVGDNGAEFVRLKKGDIVFNHLQTEQLLKNGYVFGRGTALASGTAMSYGSSGVSSNGKAKLPDRPAPYNSSTTTTQNTNSYKNNTSSVNNNTSATQANTDAKEKEKSVAEKLAGLYDWVAVKLEYFGNRTKQIADRINDYISKAVKTTLLNRQIKSISKEIDVNSRAGRLYRQQAEKVATDTGMSSDLVDKAIRGEYLFEELSDEDKEKVETFLQYYDKFREAEDNVRSLRNEQLKLYDDWASMPIEKAQENVDKLSDSITKLGNAYELATSGASSLSAYMNTYTGKQNTALNPNKEPSKNEQRLKKVEDKLTELQKGGGVNLLSRPKISTEELIKAGWEDAGEGYATLFSSTFSNAKGDVAVNFTPILVDEKGKYKGVLSPDELQKYAEEVIDGVHDDYLKLQIGSAFNGDDAIKKASDAAEKYHELHELLYPLRSTVRSEKRNKASTSTPIYDVLNNLLDTQLKEQKSTVDQYKRALRQTKSNTKKAQSEMDRLAKRSVRVTATATSKGTELAGEGYIQNGLSADQLKQLKSGKTVNTTGITDSKVLDAIKEYNKLVQLATTANDNAEQATLNYNIAIKKEEEALSSLTDAETEYAKMVVENEEKKFQNIQTYYQGQLEYQKALAETASSERALSQAYGEEAERVDYMNEIIRLYRERSILMDEQVKLQKQLNDSVASGKIQKGSQEYLTMLGAIEGLNKEINSTTTSIISLHNEMSTTLSFQDIEKQLERSEKRLSSIKDLISRLGSAMSSVTSGKSALSAYLKVLKEFGANNDAQKILQGSENTLSAQNALLDRQLKEQRRLVRQYSGNVPALDNLVESTAKARETAVANYRTERSNAIANGRTILNANARNLSSDQRNALRKGQNVDTTGVTDPSLLEALKKYNELATKSKTANAYAKQALDDYNKALDKQKENLKNLASSEEEYAKMIVQIEQDKFKNIQTYYKSIADYRANLADMVSNNRDLKEAFRLDLSKGDFTREISQLEKQRKAMTEERTALQIQLNKAVEGGSIVSGSEEYQEMAKTINNLGMEINKLTIDMVGLQDQMREETIMTRIQKALDDATESAEKFNDRLNDIKNVTSAVSGGASAFERYSNIIAKYYGTDPKNLNREQRIVRKYHSDRAHVGQNALLDLQSRQQKSVLESYEKAAKTATKLVSTAQSEVKNAEKSARSAQRTVNNRGNKLAGRTSVQNALTNAQMTALQKGQAVSTTGIKDSSVLKLITEYNDLVTQARMKNEDAKHATEIYNDALEKQKTIMESVKNAEIEYATMLVENEKQKLDNLHNYYASIQAYSKAVSDNIASAREMKDAYGEDTIKSDYTKEIKELQRQRDAMQKEQDEMRKSLEEAVDKGIIEIGSQEHYEMKQQVSDLGDSIDGITKQILDLQDEMRNEIFYRALNKALEVAERLRTSLSTISDIIKDEMMFDNNGNITDLGITSLAMNVKEYQSALSSLSTLMQKRDKIISLYNDGKNSTNYNKKEFEADMNAITGEIQDMLSNVDSLRTQITDMLAKTSKAELDATLKVIDARSQLLQKQKEYYDYDKTLKGKTNDLQAIESQIRALEGMTSLEDQATKKRLELQKAQLQDELDETVREHAFELEIAGLDDLKTALNDNYENYVNELNGDLKAITSAVSDATKTVNQSLNTVNSTVETLLGSYNKKLSGEIIGVPKYASGTKRVGKNTIGLTNEHGGEIVVTNRGIYMPLSKDSGVVPSYLTQNLFGLAENYNDIMNGVNGNGNYTVSPVVNSSIVINGTNMNEQDLIRAINKQIPEMSKKISNDIKKDLAKSR